MSCYHVLTEEKGKPLGLRELELLENLAIGQSLKEAAVAMHITYGTVKVMTMRLYRKLDVQNAHGAVGAGFRKSLLRNTGQ